LRAGLRVIVNDSVEVYSPTKRFRFAVVDLDNQVDYPRNFVCMLPTHFSESGKTQNAFMKIFGDQSVEKAKTLLKDALRTEEESAVKAEIQRRLDLLEPEHKQIRCSGCGKLFQPRRVRKFSLNFCENCLRKKFAGRE